MLLKRCPGSILLQYNRRACITTLQFYPLVRTGCFTIPKIDGQKLPQNPQLCASFFIGMKESMQFTYSWPAALRNGFYRKRFITGLVLLTGVLTAFPFYFQYIQKREGAVLNDVLLEYLPVANVSVPLFITIWLTALLIVVRVIKNPRIFLNFLWVFIVLSVMRFITIWFVAINPPQKLIALIDPLSNAFYGKNFITKDLFFSGHTATMFIIFLCLEKKIDRRLALCSSIIVGVLVLIQHVHYTVDVICAFPFGWLAYFIGTKLAGLRRVEWVE